MSTYYSAHRKFANKGYSFPVLRMKSSQSIDTKMVEPLKSYIKELMDPSWNAASNQFEEDLLSPIWVH